MTVCKKKYTILIDLDGVLNTYVGKDYKEDYIPPVQDNAKEFLEQLHKRFDLKLFTTRQQTLVEKWLTDNDLKQYFSEITNVKKPALLIIDDRCITFDGNFDNLYSQINNFKPWYKQYKLS